MMARPTLNKSEDELMEATSEVKRLNREKSNLTIELNQLVEKLSKMKEEQILLESKAKKIIEDANDEAKKIKEEASVLYEKIKQKEAALDEETSRIKSKERELAELKKEAQDSIKSNQGLRSSLDIMDMEFKEKISKIRQLKNSIIEILENL